MVRTMLRYDIIVLIRKAIDKTTTYLVVIKSQQPLDYRYTRHIDAARKPLVASMYNSCKINICVECVAHNARENTVQYKWAGLKPCVSGFTHSPFLMK